MKWSPEATVSSLGLMPFFIEFLKTSGLFEQWVEDCPLQYSSGNAPAKRDVLGTLLLSVLAGHWRYAHINAIRGDGINPELLGMSGVASEDSVRRGMKAMDEAASGQWLKGHLKASYEPLLQEPWILDVDTTVKPLSGTSKTPRWATTRRSQDDRRTRITVTLWRISGWCWTWRCRRAIRRRRCMRSRNFGPSWTDWGSGSVRSSTSSLLLPPPVTPRALLPDCVHDNSHRDFHDVID